MTGVGNSFTMTVMCLCLHYYRRQMLLNCVKTDQWYECIVKFGWLLMESKQPFPVLRQCNTNNELRRGWGQCEVPNDKKVNSKSSNRGSNVLVYCNLLNGVSSLASHNPTDGVCLCVGMSVELQRRKNRYDSRHEHGEVAWRCRAPKVYHVAASSRYQCDRRSKSWKVWKMRSVCSSRISR